VLLVGPPGVGKSHLVQAIGREVLKAGFLVLYRSIFDLARELLIQETQVAESRLLNKYLKPDLLEEWGKLLNDVPAASVILDRLLHHAEIIPINGRSYRLQSKSKRASAPERSASCSSSPNPA
jgi:DNA replication protein DnaC